MKDVGSSAKMRFQVEGMDCSSCATKIENAVRRMPGVTDVSVSVAGGTVTVGHDIDGIDRDEIRNRISGLGYRVARAESDGSDFAGDGRQPSRETRSRDEDATAWWRTRKGMLAIGSAIALAAAFALGKAFPATEQWAFLLAMTVGLIPIARRAFSGAMAGTPFSIEMLMSIAAVGAVVIGATEEAATVVFLFLIGELLEGVAASRVRACIQDLTKLVPKTARLEEDGQIREVQAPCPTQ